MKKLKIVIIVISMIILIPVICSKKNTDYKPVKNKITSEELDRIEIETGEYLFQDFDSYIIDFNNNTFTHEDYSYDKKKVTYFSDECKQKFIYYANIYKIFSWKKSYKPKNEVSDGGYTHFIIIYNDGLQYEIWCSNAYPVTYDEVWEKFLELFGDYMIKENDYEKTT